MGGPNAFLPPDQSAESPVWFWPSKGPIAIESLGAFFALCPKLDSRVGFRLLRKSRIAEKLDSTKVMAGKKPYSVYLNLFTECHT